MGKITRKSDREDTPKPRRKRRKKDLDNIHLKILKAKRKLDNVEKDGKKSGQKRQGRTKICSRLLPRPFAGIYRNGAKGKDIQNERSENTVVKARLEGDALQLFNGDTSESKSEVESTIYDKAIKQSSEKEFVKNSLEWTPYTFEHSPVFGKKQERNQKLCLIKKKNSETLFEKCDSNKLRKQDINDSKCIVQKEDMCKRKLFQNDREQSDNNSTTQIQIFDNVDLLEEKIVSKKKRKQICPEGSKSISWDPLSRYMELCARISVENFEEDFLKNYESDPLTTTIKNLRQTYANSYRQQLLRDKMKRLNPESSIEFQACTNSDNSRLSSVEFEVSKCSENHATAIRLQEDASQIDKFCLNPAQNGEFNENGDKTQYNSTSYLSQDTFIEPVTNTSLAENCKNNDKQYARQSPNIHHSSSRLLSFYFVDEKAAVRLNSRKNPNQVNFSSKNNRYDKEYTNSFHIDIPTSVNSRSVNKTEHLESLIFPNTLSAERHLSKDRTHMKLPIKLVDTCKSVAISGNHLLNNAFRKCNNNTANKHNAKNIRRVPTILRRCNNVTVNKDDYHVQVNGDYMENLRKQSEINPINENSGNNITEKFYEAEFSNMFKNLSTPSTADMTLDRSDILESHIGSMKIKNSQESQAGKCEVNMCSSKDRTDEFCQFDGCLHSQAFKDSHNTSMHIEKLHSQRKQVMPNMRKQHLSHLINNRSTNHLQDTSLPNVTIEPAKQFFQQTKSQVDSCRHAYENGSKKMLFTKCTRDQNQNIFLKSVKIKSMPMENHTQDNRTDKKCGASAYEEMFNKTDVECTKNYSNQNTCHCSKRYTCVNSTDFPHKCNVSQTCHFHKKITQPTTEPEISHDVKGCTGSCTNLLNNAQNVQLLSLEPKHSYMYPKAADNHCHAMLLQNVAQPIKYLAVKNGTQIQRVPVYVNEGSIGITENLPLKVVTLMDSTSSRARAFPQEITTQVIPLQTSGLQLNDLAMRNDSDQTFTKRLNCVNAVLLNPDLQPSTWYPTNL